MRFLRFVLATGFGISAVVTVIIVVWEWLENPSGIFHDESGTNWRFVYETAISWFVPTFLVAAGIAAMAYLAWSVIARLRD
jgi:hypothetical protein